MSVKTITVSEDAYTCLAALKTEQESFSDVIKRITGKYSLLELAGMLSEKEAHELDKAILRSRKSMGEKMSRMAKELR